jgi:glycosyltransferase involved in cell wall biosynthesis
VFSNSDNGAPSGAEQVTRKRDGNGSEHESRVSYVLITPAKDEGKFIRGALESVIAQTKPPSQWVIVDDGSKDDTAGVIEQYMRHYPFIHLVRLQHDQKRQFSSKVTAFNAGLETIDDCGYAFLGNLDADITLKADYFETVLEAFKRDPTLGIAGGRIHTTINGEFVCNDNTMDSVAGAVQFFRRNCFEDIGGYRALPFGGIDAAAEIIARSKGWRVCKVDQPVYEHRQTGSVQTTVWRSRFKDGLKFHSLGYSSLFFLCKCIHRVMDNPMLIGSVLSMIAFVSATIRRYPVYLAGTVVQYLQAEQNAKLRRTLMFHLFPRQVAGTRHAPRSQSR